jgi:glycyl-tRNA synthetase
LAEIEHFVDPSNKDHEKFHLVKDVILPLYPQENQLGDKQLQHVSVADAVANVRHIVVLVIYGLGPHQQSNACLFYGKNLFIFDSIGC